MSIKKMNTPNKIEGERVGNCVMYVNCKYYRDGSMCCEFDWGPGGTLILR